MKPAEQRILDDIEQFGCHVTSVFDPNQVDPSFSYSIGLTKTLGVPEVIVIGVRSELGHSLVNLYMERARGGESFLPSTPYLGFLSAFPVYFRPVLEDYRKTYMLSATRLYGGTDFQALQIIYPTTSGIWPWDKAASEWFRNNQPLLGESAGGP
ncbi:MULTISPECIES: DUF4262 domain-containing protein [unclassified Pseudoxanthomonas]|uniref:DUF4262 domain-containing protein n=1 Tax=unclassified Pseudoxanthomonas TaxID=2645906 RepID=UPI0030783249